MSESATLQRIKLAIGGRPDCRVFRNQVGQGWYGKLISGPAPISGRVVLDGARPLRAGLCTGSSDLVGWCTINGVARFVAIEVKSEREQTTDAQDVFLAAVIRAGGIGIVARSGEDAIRGLDGDGPSS